MKLEKETVLEHAVFFSALWNDNWENILMVKDTRQTVSHYIQYRITDFVLCTSIYQKKEIFYSKCYEASGENRKWKCCCFPYHLHSQAINMGQFLKLKSQISSGFMNLIEKSARDHLFLNFFILIFFKTNKVRHLSHAEHWKQVVVP